MPTNVQALVTREPAREVAALPAGCHVLVMTHSHPLDFDIAAAALARDDLAYVGLIGSRSKRKSFERRMRKLGARGLDRLTCPIGAAGIGGKKPAEIAVAVAAELLELRTASGSAGRRARLRAVDDFGD